MDGGDKCVVFGGSGFLGSHLADELSGQGYRVTIFDREPSRWSSPEQEMIVAEILDEDAIRGALQDAKYVFHLAGQADIDEAAAKPRETISNNVMGSTLLLECAIEADIERFVFASTVYVCSDLGSFYRISKQAVEALIEGYHETSDLQFTILRYGSLYGPRAQSWNGLRGYVKQALSRGSIEYAGTGDEKRDYIHVNDAARLSVQVLDTDYANGIFTVSGTQTYTSRELMRMIAEMVDRDIEVSFRPEERQGHHYSITPFRFRAGTAQKIVPTRFVELGQGILEVMEEVSAEMAGD